MRTILLLVTLFFGLTSFSQKKPEIKIILYWETNSDYELFKELAEKIDSNKYLVELAPAQVYRDTAIEYKVIDIALKNKRARVSPYEQEISQDETSFVKFYCAQGGMCLGTLWCSNYTPASIELWYDSCISVRNEFVKYYEKKSKSPESTEKSGSN